jgi:hypothetical protein
LESQVARKEVEIKMHTRDGPGHKTEHIMEIVEIKPLSTIFPLNYIIPT